MFGRPDADRESAGRSHVDAARPANDDTIGELVAAKDSEALQRPVADDPVAVPAGEARGVLVSQRRVRRSEVTGPAQ
ncbi:MAG: hypothetical protein ACR2MA_05225 [Egibacteraceae bacterium]